MAETLTPKSSTRLQQEFLLFPDQFGKHPEDTIEQAMAARDEALEMVQSGRPATVARARIVIVSLLSRQPVITADDVAAAAPELYEEAPAAIGTAFMGLSKRKIIMKVGYGPSKRKTRHANNMGQWGRGPQWDKR